MQSEIIEMMGSLRHNDDPRLRSSLSAPSELLDMLGPAHRLVSGDHVYRNAELRTALYWIQGGSAKLYRFTSSGEEHIVSFCFAGDWVGLDALGASHYNCASAALETTFVHAIPLSQLDATCQATPSIYQWLLRLISCHITRLQSHVMLLGKMNATERMASFLLNLASRFSAYDFRLSMSRYAIGCYLGMSFETVSRQLHLFEDAGLIQIRGRNVRLTDPVKLRSLLDGMSNPAL